MSRHDDIAEALAVLREGNHAAVATVHGDGAPAVAVVGVAANDDLTMLVFDTLETTRKLGNLKRDGRVALTAWHGAKTIQIEGNARIAAQHELAMVKQLYFATFPDGPSREVWPGISYVVIGPTWIRMSDFSGETPRVVMLESHEI